VVVDVAAATAQERGILLTRQRLTKSEAHGGGFYSILQRCDPRRYREIYREYH
jgi:hypothetical protein